MSEVPLCSSSGLRRASKSVSVVAAESNRVMSRDPATKV